MITDLLYIIVSYLEINEYIKLCKINNISLRFDIYFREWKNIPDIEGFSNIDIELIKYLISIGKKITNTTIFKFINDENISALDYINLELDKIHIYFEYAIRLNKMNSIIYFYQKKINQQTRYKKIFSPIKIATDHNNIEAVKYFMENGEMFSNDVFNISTGKIHDYFASILYKR